LVDLYLIVNPALTSGVLTVILFIYLLISAVTELLLALETKPDANWIWHLLACIVSLAIAIMLISQFPFSGTVAVGVVLGLRAMSTGASLIFRGLVGRRITKAGTS
jgi:uncharacterized membrane protein HdeD (DUF308 family)